MSPDPKQPNSARQTIQMVCAVVGMAAALGVMFALGVSGAIPGALFGAVGGGLGGAVGWLLSMVLVKD
jgi:hypothetical protein